MTGRENSYPAPPGEFAGIKGRGKALRPEHENSSPGASSFPYGRKFARIAPYPTLTDLDSASLARRDSCPRQARVNEDSKPASHFSSETYLPRPSIQNHGTSQGQSNIPESNGWVDGSNIPMVDIREGSSFLTAEIPFHAAPRAGAKPHVQTPLPFNLPVTIYSPPVIPHNPQTINPETPERGFCPTCHILWNNLREHIMAFTFSRGLQREADVSGELLKSYFGLDYHWRQDHAPAVFDSDS
ncbi:hypothetical protein EV426DRAFT_591372 [Tirmania nivea]|nr:hypothetical protein EV426DRAFT_591372 [Tirmania nivea]